MVSGERGGVMWGFLGRETTILNYLGNPSRGSGLFIFVSSLCWLSSLSGELHVGLQGEKREERNYYNCGVCYTGLEFIRQIKALFERYGFMLQFNKCRIVISGHTANRNNGRKTLCLIYRLHWFFFFPVSSVLKSFAT